MRSVRSWVNAIEAAAFALGFVAAGCLGIAATYLLVQVPNAITALAAVGASCLLLPPCVAFSFAGLELMMDSYRRFRRVTRKQRSKWSPDASYFEVDGRS